MFIIIVFLEGGDRAPGPFFSFMLSVLLSILPPHFLPSSLCLCLITFLLFPCVSVWENTHSCMSSSFPIAILNGTCFF